MHRVVATGHAMHASQCRARSPQPSSHGHRTHTTGSLCAAAASRRMSSTTTASKPMLRGVVFDMDGTLTVPNLDFSEMYRRCGVPLDHDLLRAIEEMPEPQAAAAHDVISEMEAEGRRTLSLMAGTAPFCMWLHRHKIPMAIVTRNTAETVEHLHDALCVPAGLPCFAPDVSRDTINIPPKPDAAAMRHIADRWGVSCGPELLMVGDSPSNDVAFGKAAGVTTALLDTGRRYLESKAGKGLDGAGATDADLVVHNLADLPKLLWQRYELGVGTPAAPQLTKYPPPTPISAACVAAAGGDVNALRALPTGALSVADDSENSPLIFAANNGHADAVRTIVSRIAEKGTYISATTPHALVPAALNARGYLGATALCRASARGHLEVVEILLAASPAIDADTPNAKMQSPLHFAAFKRHPEVVQALLNAGASPVSLDRKGRTPAEDTADAAIRETLVAATAAYWHA